MENNNLSTSLLSYLKQENIVLDKEAFNFRLLTHPNYPGLSSIVNTLEYFDITCDAYQVDIKNLNSTPDHYLTFLKGRYGKQDLHHVQKKDNTYYLDTQKTSIAHLKNRWKGIVLLLEGKTNQTSKNSAKTRSLIPILGISSLLIFIGLIVNYNTVLESLFYIFPLTGLVLSILSLKHIFQIENPVFDKFCKISTNSDCNSVINSKKWKIFEKISFSDISLIFFLSQLVSYFALSIADYTSAFFAYQTTILYCSLAIIAASIYFQKFVEKKWCPICLGISAILIIEAVYIQYLIEFKHHYNTNALLLFGAIVLGLTFSWTHLKKLFNRLRFLEEIEIKSTRFLRNYSVFKTAILKTHSIDPITLNSNNADLTITLITNPFCDYCQQAHSLLEKIKAKYPNRVSLDLLLNIDIEDEYEEYKLVCQRMITMQLNNKGQQFLAALHDWFEDENPNGWLVKYDLEIDENKANKTLITQKQWCIQNQVDFTPAVLINGYKYPLIYDIEHLDYFIQDLLNDSDFLTQERKYSGDLQLV
ncbi:vitamin K epoxide reductase family protein [Aquimarina spongiae]|uniref:Uncharacterized membrane protein n=1 Tax=Aquimarina spongiae TaxID=570521 RepID=A0A1M6IFF4_9FLAO|nr:vitamin K epoxide reductase family protein [Aquimarina spongiae]SHJ33179.1 Uncharacterized membrane protein [Aquimarina spongiae]